MTFEELRITYQSDEQIARALFDRCDKLQRELSVAEAMLSLQDALRARAAAAGGRQG